MNQLNSNTGGPASQRTGGSTNDSSDSKASRKRTKTGCLTCRQRRIKCGEERPTCQNCAKSKRDCQGYNQRVIFKEPLNAFRPPASFSRLATAVSQQQQQGKFQQYEPRRVPFPQNELAPQKTAPRSTSTNFSSTQVRSIPIMSPMPTPNPNHLHQFHSYQPESGSSTSESSPEATAPLTPSSQAQDDFGYQLDQFEPPPIPDHHKLQPPSGLHYDYQTVILKQEHCYLDEHHGPSRWNGEQDTSNAFHQSYQDKPNHSFAPLVGGSQQLNGDEYYAHHHQAQSVMNNETQQNIATCESRHSPFSPHLHQNQVPPHFHESTWQEGIPFRPASGVDEDDQSDVNSTPQSTMYPYYPDIDYQDKQLKRNDLGNVMALQALQDNHNWAIRSLSTYLGDPNELATYQPSSSPTPLQDPRTARIFLHFINVTGQNISMYERHPADPALMFSGRPVPHTNQHLWSYTMPTLALTNSGLLHAMLAISSLHMANIQKTSTVPSLKHYHIALRRIAKGLNSPRRGRPATLAGTMLLGFYEVMSADHQKWTSHLLGAKQLIKEINFPEKTKEVNAIKKQKRTQASRKAGWEPQWTQRPIAEYDGEVDEGFISTLTGAKLDEARHGSILDEQEESRNHIYTDRDIEIYENQRDLFWWFCKQDVYQSILSGNKLFVEYENWSDCPPRAPIGRWEASYGTFDHVILLLGRVANFAAKDIARKRKVMQSNGGTWRPAPEMMRMPAPSASHGPPPPAQPGPPRPPQMPPFVGMMQAGDPATLPMGFTASRDSPEPIEDDASLDVQTAKAIQEWNEIQNAFKILTTCLGQDFRPINPIYATPIETPFGAAYQFRSYAMAGIWLNYYMGLIVHARSHPYMPPAAHMAAGIAAPQTKTWSQELGCVCGGLVTADSDADLTILHSSAMIECSVPMFIAAVQYQEQNEREWTIKKLRDIARLSGWHTAAVIASGCEGAWIKAAEIGKGKPYKRPEGDVGAGYDRPGLAGGNEGGVYWGFDGNRTSVDIVEEVDGAGADGWRRDRRAVLYRGREDLAMGENVKKRPLRWHNER